jgi:hypothetical protein
MNDESRPQAAPDSSLGAIHHAADGTEGADEDGPVGTAPHRPGRPPPRPTQRDRVLNALRHAGDRGITATDFALPNVIDGGPPIARLAARVDELRAGHHIEHAGRRNRCAIYRLVTLPAPVIAPPADDDPSALFGTTIGAAPPRSPYDCRAAA